MSARAVKNLRPGSTSSVRPAAILRPGSARSPKSNSPAPSSRSSASRADAVIPRKIGVTNGLFAEHPVLRRELLARYPDARFREERKSPTEDEVIEILADCDGAIVGLEPINERVLSALPKLKVIGKFGIGWGMLDFDALRKQGILIAFTPGTTQLAVR